MDLRMMKTRAETEFNRELVRGADRLKREIGYNPARFNQMVADHGGPEAARLLLSGRDASEGFATLWEAGRLEMSVEAIAAALVRAAPHRPSKSKCSASPHRPRVRSRRFPGKANRETADLEPRQRPADSMVGVVVEP